MAHTPPHSENEPQRGSVPYPAVVPGPHVEAGQGQHVHSPDEARAEYEGHESTQAVPQEQSAGSGLMIGLAIGALVGGIVGGGTAAIVTANSEPPAAPPTQTGTVTITNPEHATAVSAIAAVAADSVVTLDVRSNTGSGTGSGVIYSEDGYIITNAHVVTMPESSFANTTVRVLLSDGTMLDGRVVGSDPYADIAVVKVDAQSLNPITVADSEEITVGDLAVAIGAPFDLSGTVTSGVVSALNRGISVGSPHIPLDPEAEDQDPSQPENPWDFQFDIPGQEDGSPQAGGQVTLPVIQTDADINPGNSGGALLNAEGNLVGINVAIASTGSLQDGNQGSVGLGFAIPSNLATRIADAIIAGEQPTHGLLGATVGDSRVSDEAVKQGGLVREVTPGGAAERAGIRAGDVIVSVNGVRTTNGTAVSAMIRYHEGDSEVDITLDRAGTSITERVELGTLNW